MPLLMVMLVLFLGSQCSSSQAPPQAPPNDSDSSRDIGTGLDVGSSSNDDTSLDESDDSDDDGDSSSGDYERTCVDVGGDELVEQCNECLEEGKFFDRFDDDGAGKCTRIELALTDCTEDAVQEFMSKNAKSEFKKALNSSFEDFELDQCVDCPPDSGSKHCENNDGKEQVGTKLFFIEKDDNSITGKNILIKSRPGKDDGDDED